MDYVAIFIWNEQKEKKTNVFNINIAISFNFFNI